MVEKKWLLMNCHFEDENEKRWILGQCPSFFDYSVACRRYDYPAKRQNDTTGSRGAQAVDILVESR